MKSERPARQLATCTEPPIYHQCSRPTGELAIVAGIGSRTTQRNQPGPYQLRAAIAAVHSDAPSVAETDRRQVVALYDHLLTFTPTPAVALNRAVAVAEVDGPAAGLELADALGAARKHLWHAVRAELLRRLDRRDEADAAYRAALGLAQKAREQAHL